MEAEMEDFEEHICLSDHSASSNLPRTFEDQSENRALPRRQGAKSMGRPAYITKMEAQMEDFEEHICLSDQSASSNLPRTFEDRSVNRALPRRQGAKSMGRSAYITKMEAEMEDLEDHICLSDHSASSNLPRTFEDRSVNRALPRRQGAKSMGRPAYITKMEAEMEDFEEHICLSDQSASRSLPRTFQGQSENRALPRRQGAKSMGRSAYITKMEAQMEDFEEHICLSDQSASSNLPRTFEDQSENRALPRRQGAKSMGRPAYITKMEAQMESKDFQDRTCLSDQSASGNLSCTFQDRSENRALPRRQGAKSMGRSAYITKMEAQMEDLEDHICLSDQSASSNLPRTFEDQSENRALPRRQGAKSVGKSAYITKMEAEMEDLEDHICLSDQSASSNLPRTFEDQSENRALPRRQGAKSVGKSAYITKMEAEMEDLEDHICLSDQSASSNLPRTFQGQSENRTLPRRQGAKSMGRPAYITKMEAQMESKDFQDRTCLSDQSASGNLSCTFQDQSENRALPRVQGAKVVGRSAYITKMEAQMGSKDYQDRIQAIDQIVESCCLNPAMVTACIFPVFDNIRGRLVESNRIINLHMLKALDAIIPQVKESLPKVANIVIPAIVDNHFNSRNPAISSAALAAMHALVQNLDNTIMVEILATKAQLIGGQAKLDLTHTVADMVEEAYSRKPKMVEKEVLPLLWHMLAVSSNSAATGALLSALHSQMGTKLRTHAASQPFTITKCLDHFLRTV
ncbi:uncharacterized protein LOC135244869 [Anguilla rostrata]|uniref:uncharacterized protein LOC135244869 n=1 Tax=Anguilla rostrata TaxID=7938 RepID=UPI0030CD7094